MKTYLLDLKTLSILIVIALIAMSYGLFFYYQSITENQIRSALFEQQEQRQQGNTKAVASHIQSDLSSVLSSLRLLAESPSFQKIDDGGNSSNANNNGNSNDDAAASDVGDAAKRRRSLTQELFVQLNTDSQGNLSPLIDRLYVSDENGIILIDTHSPNNTGKDETGVGAGGGSSSGSSTDQNFEGYDLSSTEYFQDAKTTLKPVFSRGIKSLDGKYIIAIAYPIVGEGDGKFKGLVIATPLVSTFFQHYGNIHDIGSQYLAVLDRDSVQLVHPVSSFVGTPFFGEATQEATGHIEVLNNLVAKVMAGQSGEAVYEFRNGERLTTGYPVYLAGQPTYFVFVITPTSVIYANVADALSAQRIETFSLLAGTTASIFVLLVFLAMWNNNLRKAVIAKTEQLVEANKQLSIANDQLTENYEQLRASERMQKEFINVAAHELRTPIQPIIGLSDLLLNRQHINKNNRPIDQETRVLLETIRRNARRLYRLSSDILDVTKIESRAMHLEKKEVDILELLKQVVEEAKSQIADGNKIEVVLVTPRNGEKDDDGQMKVFADSQRIQQVISNLLDNAIKFTEQGTITVTAEKKEGGEGRDVIVVKVIDTGSGIHPDVFPQLFTKFVTRSDRGTGLGLYISKSIIEAHGGKIWAENNNDGRGATFSFSLPVAASVTTSTAAAGENEANG